MDLGHGHDTFNLSGLSRKEAEFLGANEYAGCDGHVQQWSGVFLKDMGLDLAARPHTTECGEHFVGSGVEVAIELSRRQIHMKPLDAAALQDIQHILVNLLPLGGDGAIWKFGRDDDRCGGLSRR